MSDALWQRFLVEARDEAAALAAAARLAALSTAEQHRLAGAMFALQASAALLGVDALARAAGAAEAALTENGADAWGDLRAPLAACAAAMTAAIDTLARPDASGARLDDTRALDAAIAALGGDRDRSLGPPPLSGASPAMPTDDAVWVPQVDADMVEPFLEEAAERIEALAQKLMRLESSPGDVELVREIFRDLHTIKGSSAFVGLKRMNQLAHAAEDLVGQLRDGARSADRAVIDALLGALDALRAILQAAASIDPTVGARIDVSIEREVARLRAPGASVGGGPSSAPSPASASSGVAGSAAADGQRTLRVDFDKLDTLLNLVGELVLARARLHGTIASVSVLSRELDGLVRRARMSRGRLDLDDVDRFQRILAELGNDLGGGAGALDHVSAELRQQVMKLRMLPIARVFTKYHRTVRELVERPRQARAPRHRRRRHRARQGAHRAARRSAAPPRAQRRRPRPRAAGRAPRRREIGRGRGHARGASSRQPDHRRGARRRRRHRAGAPARKGARESSWPRDDELGRHGRHGRARPHLPPRLLDGGARHRRQRPRRRHGRRARVDPAPLGIDRAALDPGAGTTFVLRLPLTLAIVQVLLVRVAGEDYALPLDIVKRTLAVTPADVHRVYDCEVLFVGDEQIPLLWTAEALEMGDGGPPVDLGGAQDWPVVLVDAAGQTYALAVERLVGKREIVLKSLGALLSDVPCAAGATLIGERVAVILDVVQLVQRALNRPATRAPVRVPAAAAVSDGKRRPRILLAEDSDVVREQLKRVLEAHGYDVVAARDGAEALELAERDPLGFDLVSTDVMMPKLDGYELTRALRQHPRHRDVPLIMVTSKGEHLDRVRGFDAGVDEYMTKPLDSGELVRVIDRHIARHIGRRHA